MPDDFNPSQNQSSNEKQFSAQKISEKKISLPIPIIDPGALNTNFSDHVKELVQLSKGQSSLRGFPFWKVIMIWIRLRTHQAKDLIPPTIETYDSDIKKILNPSRQVMHISLSLVDAFIPLDSCLMISPLESFENPEMKHPTAFENVFSSNEPVLFLSLVGVPTRWTGIQVNLTVDSPISPNSQGSKSSNNSQNSENDFMAGQKFAEIDIDEIHTPFLEDMENFVVKWTSDDTAQLLDLLPLDILSRPVFSEVAAIARSSSLCLKYPEPVVLLRALIIHHINYIRFIQKNISDQEVATLMSELGEIDFDDPDAAKKLNLGGKAAQNFEIVRTYVSTEIWKSATNLVSPEFLAKDVLSNILFNTANINMIEVNRMAAVELKERGLAESQQDSIIGQVTKFLVKNASNLRQKDRIWRVNFKNEDAIDAGGPSKELITLACSSIFEKTTLLFIRSPNSRRGKGPNADKFVPFPQIQQANALQQYKAIGVLLGCVIRMGLSEDLPFAPFVWKFLAEENLTVEDVLAVDSDLAEMIQKVQTNKGTEEIEWIIPNWDGNLLQLAHHQVGEKVKPQQAAQFAQEATNVRIAVFQPFLVKMREGLRENLGMKHNGLLTGPLLSRMAQGSSVVTLPHLKAITKSLECQGHQDIERFWRVCERLTPSQLKLLLQFITTLPRMPNSLVGNTFCIKIDVGGKTDSLPTASTCFNKLHIPHYSSDDICYGRLVTAISECVSMEMY